MDEEPLCTYDEAGRPTGAVPRGEVHARGLWHRSVHVWVFAPDGRVYVQRRGPDKDINPDRWDVSVGEHLQPGEAYVDAAHRGLREELGVEGLELLPLGAERPVTNERPDLAIFDRELQQAFRATHDGPVRPDPQEVTEVRLVEPQALRDWFAAEPGAFTPGFARDVEDLGLLDAS